MQEFNAKKKRLIFCFDNTFFPVSCTFKLYDENKINFNERRALFDYSFFIQSRPLTWGVISNVKRTKSFNAQRSFRRCFDSDLYSFPNISNSQ